MLLLSTLSIILANLINYFAPAIFLPELDPQKTQDTLFAVLMPSPESALGYIHAAVSFFVVLSIVLLATQVREALKYPSDRKLLILNFVLLAASFPLVRPVFHGLQYMGYASRAGNVIPLTKDTARWNLTGLEGFTVYIPPELRQGVSGNLDPLAAYGRGVPYAYAGFICDAPANMNWFYEHFEVRLGVHENSDGLSPAEYVKRRNSQLEAGGRKLNVFLMRDLTAGKFKGLEDTVNISGRSGRYTLSRAILQYKDKFLVISAVVGSDQIVPEYKSAFDAIVQTVSLDRANPPRPLRIKKQAKQPRKIQLEEF